MIGPLGGGLYSDRTIGGRTDKTIGGEDCTVIRPLGGGGGGGLYSDTTIGGRTVL